MDWPDNDDEPRPPVHWKTSALVGWAANRPFVWIDDEITDAGRHWVQAQHPARAPLRTVNPRCGLAHTDIATIRSWLAQPAA